uniref:Uncharacterized protein n=1 Tax=Arundo donax TaxID=35708 RepID=A0A0A8Z1E9_ARUDO
MPMTSSLGCFRKCNSAYVCKTTMLSPKEFAAEFSVALIIGRR